VNAQKASAEARRRLEDDVQARLQKAAEAAQEVGKKAGVSPETLAEINRALGVV
jgi:lambda repressor-like predicted transcriptional regulator